MRLNHKTFKKFIEEMENAPIVVRAENPASQMLSDALKYIQSATNYLLQLSITNESVSSGFVWRLEQIMENDKFQEYIKSQFGNIHPRTSGLGGYLHSCGQDSCAFYYTNKIIVKFLGGSNPEKEFNIAKSVKGMLKLFPILDAFEIEIYGYNQYVMVMKELSTKYSGLIEKASTTLSGWVHHLQDLVEKKPHISTEWVRKRLTLKYILHKSGPVDPDTADAIHDIMRIIRTVYDKSGFVIGADLAHGRNLGTTPSHKIMIYDYGRATPHAAKISQIPPEEKQTVKI